MHFDVYLSGTQNTQNTNANTPQYDKIRVCRETPPKLQRNPPPTRARGGRRHDLGVSSAKVGVGKSEVRIRNSIPYFHECSLELSPKYPTRPQHKKVDPNRDSQLACAATSVAANASNAADARTTTGSRDIVRCLGQEIEALPN
jgi:hypothetical protein